MKNITVEAWELELVGKVASAYRTRDREELEAELARRLLVFKQTPHDGIRDWPAYLSTFLYNRASNWIRAARCHENRTASMDDFEEERWPHMAFATVEDLDTPIDVAATLASLSAEQRQFIALVLEEDGNQVAAGKRLNRHRNTIHSWLTEIREVAQCARPMNSDPKSLTMSEILEPFVRVPNRLFEALLDGRFTLVELKVVLWVIRHTIGWNRSDVRCTWYGLAASLHLDRAGVFRAGKRLIELGTIRADGGRIALGPDTALMPANGDVRHRNSLSAINQTGDGHQRDSRRPSTHFRRAKDSSKDIKTIKDRAAAETVDHHQRIGHAGAAKPIPGKYGS